MCGICVRWVAGVARAVTILFAFFFSSRRRHTRFKCDWSSDVCSSDLHLIVALFLDYRNRVGERGDRLFTGSGKLGLHQDVLQLTDTLLDLSRFDIAERFAGRVGEILELLVETDAVEQLLIGRIERRSGHVFAGRAFLIAEGLLDMRERFVRLAGVGISVARKLQFLFPAVEVAL